MHARSLVILAAFAAISCTATVGQNRPHHAWETRSASASADVVNTPIPRRGGYAKASDGARIYYEVCGKGPAVVLVHGLGGNHAVWFHQVAHFAKDHSVVTLSQRGFAPSGGDQDDYDVALLVKDLAAVMDAAGVETAEAVIGQSMGGWTALGAALRMPERVRSLVLADTLGGIHDEEIASHMRAVTAEAVKLKDVPPPLGVHPALSRDFSAQHPELGYLYQTLSTFGSPAPGAIAKQLGAARVTPETLQSLRLPTLFVVGTEDRLFPPALVHRAAAYITGADVVEIPGSGHSPYFENPSAWNSAVSRFLAR